MRTEPESACTGPGGPQPSGALPCPVERQRFVREDAGRRCVTAARLSALFCIVRFMQMRESIILRYKAAQHTKNRADVRKTEGTGKSRYRGEAARTIFLGAVQAYSLRVRGLPLCGPDAREGGVRAVWTGRASKWEWCIFCLAEHSERQQCGTAGRRHGARARRRCRPQAKPQNGRIKQKAALCRAGRAPAGKPGLFAFGICGGRGPLRRAGRCLPRRTGSRCGAHKTENSFLTQCGLGAQKGAGRKARAFCVWAARGMEE